MTADITYLIEDEEYIVQQIQIGIQLFTGIVLRSPPAYKELPSSLALGNIKIKAVRQLDSFQYSETGLTQSPSTSQFNADYDSLDHVNNVLLPGFQTTGRCAFHGSEIGKTVLMSYWATGPGVTLEGLRHQIADETIPGTLGIEGLLTAQSGMDASNQKIVNLANGTAAPDAVNFGQLTVSRNTLYETRRSFHNNWALRFASEETFWRSVVYGGGQFVAVALGIGGIGGSDMVMTSPDGNNWTAQVASEANLWQCITYNISLGLFVAVSSSGTNRVMTSPDGITWTPRSASAANAWSGICSGNPGGGEILVAVSLGGTNRVMTSTNGTAWTARSAASARQWQAVAFNGSNLFCAVANDGAAASGKIMTSPDGINWTSRTAPSTAALVSIAYGDGLWVAVGNDVIVTSPDGVTWTSRTVPTTNTNMIGIAYGNLTFSGDAPEEGIFMAISSSFNELAVSSDGIIWTKRSFPADAIGGGFPVYRVPHGIAFGVGRFVMVLDDNNSPVYQVAVTNQLL